MADPDSPNRKLAFQRTDGLVFGGGCFSKKAPSFLCGIAEFAGGGGVVVGNDDGRDIVVAEGVHDGAGGEGFYLRLYRRAGASEIDEDGCHRAG